jgi:hypothetical protein
MDFENCPVVPNRLNRETFAGSGGSNNKEMSLLPSFLLIALCISAKKCFWIGIECGEMEAKIARL